MSQLARLLSEIEGESLSVDQQRQLLSRAKSLRRQDRQRIKEGLVSMEDAERAAEVKAIEEAIETIKVEFNKLAGPIQEGGGSE